MKLLKGISILLAWLICFTAIACNHKNASSSLETNQSDLQTDYSGLQTNIPNKAVQSGNLKSILSGDGFDFNNAYVEIEIHSEEEYSFNNRNKEFYQAFLTFLETMQVKAIESYEEVTPGEIGINFENSKDGLQSFSINEKDQVAVYENQKTNFYMCDGIYKAFLAWTMPLFDHYQQFCGVDYSPVRHMYEYAIYDKNFKELKFDFTSRQPHLILSDSNIVHLWMQTGTGILTRWAEFYDTNNGKRSPVYYGQTDSFGSMVVVAECRQVSIYDMFSGGLLYRINQFDKPLEDNPENIISAYFSKDGTQLLIRYYSNQENEEEQVVTLPQKLTKIDTHT